MFVRAYALVLFAVGVGWCCSISADVMHDSGRTARLRSANLVRSRGRENCARTPRCIHPAASRPGSSGDQRRNIGSSRRRGCGSSNRRIRGGPSSFSLLGSVEALQSLVTLGCLRHPLDGWLRVLVMENGCGLRPVLRVEFADRSPEVRLLL
jgi:hypothetical protein